MQCNTTYAFQTRFDLEKSQPQPVGYQEPNQLFYQLITYITQIECQEQLAWFLSYWDLECVCFVLHRNTRFLELKGSWNCQLSSILSWTECLSSSLFFSTATKMGPSCWSLYSPQLPWRPPHPSPHINEWLTNREHKRNKLATNLSR